MGQKKKNNNEEIIQDCDIFINDENIGFKYYYNFPKEGEYSIKYIFHKSFSTTNFMFYGCFNLTSLDLSNFKTDKVTNMIYMFFGCVHLKNLNLSNFNTENVDDMSGMFLSY